MVKSVQSRESCDLQQLHLMATAELAMEAVNGSMMKPSRSLMFTKVRLALLSSLLKV